MSSHWLTDWMTDSSIRIMVLKLDKGYLQIFKCLICISCVLNILVLLLYVSIMQKEIQTREYCPIRSFFSRIPGLLYYKLCIQMLRLGAVYLPADVLHLKRPGKIIISNYTINIQPVSQFPTVIQCTVHRLTEGN